MPRTLRNRDEIKAPLPFGEIHNTPQKGPSAGDHEIYTQPVRRPRNRYLGPVIEFNPNLPPAAFPTLDTPRPKQPTEDQPTDLDVFSDSDLDTDKANSDCDEAGTPDPQVGSRKPGLHALPSNSNDTQHEFIGSRSAAGSSSVDRHHGSRTEQDNITINPPLNDGAKKVRFQLPHESQPEHDSTLASNLADLMTPMGHSLSIQASVRRALVMMSRDEQHHAEKQEKQIPKWADLSTALKVQLCHIVAEAYPYQIPTSLLRLNDSEVKEIRVLSLEQDIRLVREQVAAENHLEEIHRRLLVPGAKMSQEDFRRSLDENLFRHLDGDIFNQSTPSRVEQARRYLSHCGLDPKLLDGAWATVPAANAAALKPKRKNIAPAAGFDTEAEARNALIPDNHNNHAAENATEIEPGLDPEAEAETALLDEAFIGLFGQATETAKDVECHSTAPGDTKPLRTGAEALAEILHCNIERAMRLYAATKREIDLNDALTLTNMEHMEVAQLMAAASKRDLPSRRTLDVNIVLSAARKINPAVMEPEVVNLLGGPEIQMSSTNDLAETLRDTMTSLPGDSSPLASGEHGPGLLNTIQPEFALSQTPHVLSSSSERPSDGPHRPLVAPDNLADNSELDVDQPLGQITATGPPNMDEDPSTPDRANLAIQSYFDSFPKGSEPGWPFTAYNVRSTEKVAETEAAISVVAKGRKLNNIHRVQKSPARSRNVSFTPTKAIKKQYAGLVRKRAANGRFLRGPYNPSSDTSTATTDEKMALEQPEEIPHVDYENSGYTFASWNGTDLTDPPSPPDNTPIPRPNLVRWEGSTALDI